MALDVRCESIDKVVWVEKRVFGSKCAKAEDNELVPGGDYETEQGRDDGGVKDVVSRLEVRDDG